MDNHQSWQRAYAFAVRREWAERGLITFLCLATIVVGVVVYSNWSTRYEHVFRPVAGLSYERPRALGGTAISDISEPLTYQRLSANDAYSFNASVPVSTLPIVNARPFILPPSLPAADAVRALDCLTAAIYYEAASETLPGQQAVAQVILNRVRHSAFPNSVCGVVFSGSTRKTGCQFTFTCDGALARKPSASGWARARAVARSALSGYVSPLVGQATHYHTLWVAPYWSPSLDKVANIGAHTFYRWKGVSGRPEAFNAPYAGAEPVFSLTVQATDDNSLPVEDLTLAEAQPVVPALPALEIEQPVVPVTPEPKRPEVVVSDTPVPNLGAARVDERPAAPVATVPAIEPERRRRIAAPSW